MNFSGKNISEKFSILGEIGSGGMGRVYRAMPYDDPSQDVAIKVIERRQKISSQDYLRFQKEAALMSRLHHPNIVCFHELGIIENEAANGYYIVMEIAQGDDLKNILSQFGRKSIDFCIDIGIAMSSALDYTHGKNIIHRDIKPQNIIYDEETRTTKILDFGVAKLLDGSGEASDHEIAGTPLYMAPEQTRLFDAKIDHRADLYSLGCVLYEIIVGYPPFTASQRDKLERLHVHTNPEPISHLRPEIPPIFEQIIHKLLNKQPKDRYQTAFALHADLFKLKTRLAQSDKARSVQFPIATDDSLQTVPSKIIMTGRKSELDQIKEAHTLTAQRRSRIFAVHGEMGIGKSRLLSEFKKHLSQRRERYVYCNFTEHETGLSFNALANGFNEYLARILKSQPHEAEELKRRIKTFLGPLASKIAEIVPGLVPFLENQEVSYDGDQQDFKVFAKAFSDFTRCLAIDNQPIVFIMDDLQWADEQSLNLIDEFVSYNNSQKFFLLMGYRVDGKTSTELEDFLIKFSKLKRRFHSLELMPISVNETQFIAEQMLPDSAPLDSEVVNYFHSVSLGNPSRLIETIKVLASLEQISKDAAGWQFKIKTNQVIHYNSIDQLIAQMNFFSSDERKVIENAAVIGLNFYDRPLSYICEGVDVLTAIQKFLDLGLIMQVKCSEYPDEYGVGFRFVHWRVRNILYKNFFEKPKQHMRMAHFLIDHKIKNDEKFSYYLAHHLNATTKVRQGIQPKFAANIINANLEAAQFAFEAKAYPAAQKYYENAEKELSYWTELKQYKKLMLHIREKLGDLLSVQLDFAKTVQNYDYVRKNTSSFRKEVDVVGKQIRIYLLSGYISKSETLYTQYFQKITHSAMQWSSVAKNILDLVLWVVVPKFSKIQSVMNRIKDPKYNHRDLWGRFFETGHFIVYHTNKYSIYTLNALSFATLDYKKSGTRESLRILSHQAILLAMFGFFRKGYDILDRCLDIAREKRDKPTLGILMLLKCLTLDYRKFKSDDISQNIKLSLSLIPSETERLWYALSFQMNVFFSLLQGKCSDVVKTSSLISTVVPTRSWYAPRIIAMMLMVHFLNNARDEIVKIGESFLKRRTKVYGRGQDVFSLVVRTLVSFAKGEMDKTRENYSKFAEVFANQPEQGKLWIFEQDFLALFAVGFPPLYAAEQGRELMRNVEMASIYRKLKTRFRKIPGRNRGIKNLVNARIDELVSGKTSYKKYDRALRLLKAEGLNFPLSLTYLWFGCSLIKKGKIRRKDYLERSVELAKKSQMSFLAEYAERLLHGDKEEKEKINFGVEEDYKSITIANLNYVAMAIERDISLEKSIEDGISILSNYVQCTKLGLIVVDEQTRLISCDAFDPRVIDYLGPYQNIRSTLFLPLEDAPWMVRDFSEEVGTVTTPVAQSFPTKRSFEDEKTSAGVHRYQRVPMSAIVPIYSHFGNRGVLFLEDIAFRMKDSSEFRSELDLIGSQLSLFFDKELGNKDLQYASGKYLLENCEWLRLWGHGKLRSSRESVWYYGMNLSDNSYILFYCRFNGEAQVRENCSKMLWYHIQAFTLMLKNYDRREYSVEEIYEEVSAVLKRLPGIDKLDTVSLSYTLFDREHKTASSGQFGPSRPFVVCKNNIVKPMNTEVMKLDNGRTVRFWNVSASLEGAHVYLLTHDSNRFESDTQGVDYQSLLTDVSMTHDHVSLTKVLEKLVLKDNMPRYYVGAVLLSEEVQLKKAD